MKKTKFNLNEIHVRVENDDDDDDNEHDDDDYDGDSDDDNDNNSDDVPVDDTRDCEDITVMVNWWWWWLSWWSWCLNAFNCLALSSQQRVWVLWNGHPCMENVYTQYKIVL